jgi:hypothetical protein
MSVTIEIPSFEMDRTCVSPGAPAIARSTGCVICASTSVAEREGARVTTWTWTFVTSGTASMASFREAKMPIAITKSVARMARSGFREPHNPVCRKGRRDDVFEELIVLRPPHEEENFL